MLQIESVSKTYKTGALVQQALDNVSLNLRDSEFVAILGPSGSGKTTLLNIIGGLDRYDSGSLIINGVSTKQYSARDWDSYRNHSVGFVFQSYNLIPHQSVLANVELALTIGGVSRARRRQRAKEALEQVGLKEHMHKKPAQLSGGQMQRVAIARALVNDPDILLADEPTGALDSETSLQVMDLLKEVARDRLVVMVTHNPELAERYATRTVRLKDGRITDDSDPYDPNVETPAVHRNLGKSSMSRLTSLSLSFRNLWTKKVRTLLVAFAGSIGIIGIALILSMSNGVDRYIQSVEEDTLKSYPLQITDTSFNLASFLPASRDSDEQTDAEVREWRTVTNLLSRVSVNDLKSLRDYLESGQTDVYDHVQSIEYGYSLTPRIFSLSEGKARQVNPDNSFAALGFTSTGTMSGMLTQLSSTDSFHPMPRESSLYLSQYRLEAGHWPEGWNECVLVLSAKGRVTDLSLYTMGFKDPEELERMVRSFAEGHPVTEEDGAERTYRYEDFLGVSFRVVPAGSFYVYDEDYGLWADRSGDEDFTRSLVEKGETLTIVGVVRPEEDAATPALPMGICYPAALSDHLMELARSAPIVRAQLDSRETDVFTGLPFGQVRGSETMDLSSLFKVDEEALSKAFQFDQEDLPDLSAMDLSGLDLSDLDLTGAIRPGDLTAAMPALTEQDVAKLLQGVKLELSAEDLQALFTALMEGYLAQAQDPADLLGGMAGAAAEYLASEEAAARIREGIESALRDNGAVQMTDEELAELITGVLSGYPAYLASHGVEGEELPMAYLGEYLQSPEGRAALAAAGESLRQRAEAFTLSPAQISAITGSLYAGYEDYAAQNGKPTAGSIGQSFADYLAGPEATALISQAVADAVDTSGLQQQMAAMLNQYQAGVAAALQKAMGRAMAAVSEQLKDALAARLGELTGQLTENLQQAFRVDPQALAEAFSMSMDPAELRDLMTALLSRQENSYDGNLRKLGYAAQDDPASITIYPLDFAGKTAVKAILEDYNRQMEQSGQEDKVITYTDVVDTLMSSVTDIVDAISTVLIAFVAISLVVSSVMIGVITYISVLERRKEIGVLRAIGASKRNISQVFNAETFIIGALAGLLGVGLSYLLLIPANRIIASLAGKVNIRAYLPLSSAAILVGLSIFLTLLGGFIPAKKAARQDPVAALRSE